MELTRGQVKSELIEAGIAVAQERGLMLVTAPVVAARLKVRHTLINYHYQSIANFKLEIAKEAVERGLLQLVSQALSVELLEFSKLPSPLKKQLREQLR